MHTPEITREHVEAVAKSAGKPVVEVLALLQTVAAWLNDDERTLEMLCTIKRKLLSDRAATPVTRTAENRLLNIEFYIAAARRHGEDSEPDHEVGDLQDCVHVMWRLMSLQQRLAFAMCPDEHAVLEGALVEYEDELHDLVHGEGPAE